MSRTKGAHKDYRFAQKEHWRRWMWNRLLERTGGREQHETVVYLAGPDDNDRAVAREKGVPNDALFAVDWDQKNVDKVRAKGGRAVCGHLNDVLAVWPSSAPVCGVVADLCSGLSENALASGSLYVLPAGARAVFAVNYMRGRDAWFNEARHLLIQRGFVKPRLAELLEAQDWDRNRALLAFIWECWVQVTARFNPNPQPYTQGIWGLTDEKDMGECTKEVLELIKDCSPQFHTYPSGPLRFDSMVFSSPWLRSPVGHPFWADTVLVFKRIAEGYRTHAPRELITAAVKAELKRRVSP